MTIENDEERRRKKTILGFLRRSTTLDFLIYITKYRKNHPKYLSVLQLFTSMRSGSARHQKKSCQKKRTFHYLSSKNNNCIGHTLRRVTGRKRRKRERNARVFLSSSRREKESLFLVPSIVSQRRDLNKMIFI